jgi:NADH dehydrogenase FAD-containing subunit
VLTRFEEDNMAGTPAVPGAAAPAAPPADVKNIVIIGGSYAGVSTAHYLLRHAVPYLPSDQAYQVVVVSAADEIMCRPACPRALISDSMFPQDKLFNNIPKLFDQYPKGAFRFVHGKAVDLDHGNSTLVVELNAGGARQKVRYHALVVATGASTASPLLSLNRDVSFLRSSWAAFREALPSAKTIVVAGGGPAGVETAGELGEYLNGKAGWFTSRLANPKVTIKLVTKGDRILPYLRPSIAAKAESYLAKVGVTVEKSVSVKAVEPAGAGTEDVGAKAKIVLANGTEIEADLYIPAMGTIPNTSFIPKDLLAPDGRIKTNKGTLRVEGVGSRIYALGDVADAARPAVHNVFAEVPVLCANLKRDLMLAAQMIQNPSGSAAMATADKIFKEDTRETQLVPIGKSLGVGAAMGYQLPSWLVWLIKGRDYWLWTTGNLWSGKQWAKES